MKVPEKDETVTAEKKSKLPSASSHDQEFSLPPLSEVRSREEILAEKSSTPSSAGPVSSNIAQQLLRPSGSREMDKSAHSDSLKSDKNQPDEKTGIKNWLDNNKAFAEYCKYNAKIILPSAAAVLVVCFGLYSLMSGMVKSVDHPPLGIVSGIVTLDDQPLPHAEVTFIPQDEWKADQTPAESVGFTDEQGKFELTYSKDLKGAAIGNHFVRIFSSEKSIPIIYNVNSVLKYEVKEGTNTAEFKMVSK